MGFPLGFGVGVGHLRLDGGIRCLRIGYIEHSVQCLQCLSHKCDDAFILYV